MMMLLGLKGLKRSPSRRADKAQSNSEIPGVAPPTRPLSHHENKSDGVLACPVSVSSLMSAVHAACLSARADFRHKQSPLRAQREACACEQGACACQRAPCTDAQGACTDAQGACTDAQGACTDERRLFTDAQSAMIDARRPTTDARRAITVGGGQSRACMVR